MRVPEHLRRVLETAGVAYVVLPGRRHMHVRVDGRLVTVFHPGGAGGYREQMQDVKNLKKNLRNIGVDI